MFQPLDGPGVHGAITVTSTAQELKVGGSADASRQLVSAQPLDGDIYYGYSNAVTSTTGTKITCGQFWPFEACASLTIWLVAAGGDSIDTRITEVG